MQSLNGVKVSYMVMKFEILMQNHDFSENSVESKFSQEIDFLRVEDPQNPFGSCAARNVQNFGGATCSTDEL